jgi:hypothetical protein
VTAPDVAAQTTPERAAKAHDEEVA